MRGCEPNFHRKQIVRVLHLLSSKFPSPSSLLSQVVLTPIFVPSSNRDRSLRRLSRRPSTLIVRQMPTSGRSTPTNSTTSWQHIHCAFTSMSPTVGDLIFEILVDRTSGQFTFSATVIQFVAPTRSNPHK